MRQPRDKVESPVVIIKYHQKKCDKYATTAQQVCDWLNHKQLVV